MRLAAPDGAVAGMEVRGAQTGRITRYNGRIVDVENPQHAKALLSQGAFPVSLTGRTRAGLGFRCPTCNHGSYFRRCGKCGAECEKETEA